MAENCAKVTAFDSDLFTAAENGPPAARRRRLSISPAESFLQGHCTGMANGIQRCGRAATASSFQLPAHEVLRLGRTQRTRRKSSCIAAASIDAHHTLRGSAMRGPRSRGDMESRSSSRRCAISLCISTCGVCGAVLMPGAHSGWRDVFRVSAPFLGALFLRAFAFNVPRQKRATE